MHYHVNLINKRLSAQAINPLLFHTRSIVKVINRAKLDEDVDKMLTDGLHPRKHPGRRALPCVTLPPILEAACRKVIQKYKKPSLAEDVNKMYHQFHHRQMPPEPEDIREKTKEIEYRFIEREKFIVDQMEPNEREQALLEREKKIQQALKRETYNWKSIDYDEYYSVVYMAGRMVPNFAAIKAVFHEIHKDDPSFKPQTLLDFGSGVGTTIWAANQIWPKSFTEYFNVDISQPAHDIARLLLQQGDERKPLVYDGVFTRQFLPVTSDIKYDLVVSAYSLLELPSKNARVTTVENLWHKTNDMLVLIEHGKKPGFSAILEARNLIMQITGHKVTETFHVDDLEQDIIQQDPNDIPSSHILAPCPHHYPCPKLYSGQVKPCNFSISYEHLKIGGLEKILWGNREQFSYIVLRKKPLNLKENPTWPRVVDAVKKAKRRAQCRLCCPDGTIKSLSVSKKYETKNLYNVVKLSKWSDKLPLTVYQIEKEVKDQSREPDDLENIPLFPIESSGDTRSSCDRDEMEDDSINDDSEDEQPKGRCKKSGKKSPSDWVA